MVLNDSFTLQTNKKYPCSSHAFLYQDTFKPIQSTFLVLLCFYFLFAE